MKVTVEAVAFLLIAKLAFILAIESIVLAADVVMTRGIAGLVSATIRVNIALHAHVVGSAIRASSIGVAIGTYATLLTCASNTKRSLCRITLRGVEALDAEATQGVTMGIGRFAVEGCIKGSALWAKDYKCIET